MAKADKGAALEASLTGALTPQNLYFTDTPVEGQAAAKAPTATDTHTYTGKATHTEPKAATQPKYIAAPNPREAKTKRVQLLLQPTVWERAQADATAQGLSFNDYVNKLLDKHTANKRGNK